MEIFLYIIGAVILLVVILGIIAPKGYDVFRSIDIAKSKAETFNYLKFLKNQEEWSPWERKDPDMKKEFSGTDGEVGAISSWKGNKQVGEGEQEIKRIVENEVVEAELRFFKPWKSVSDAYLKVEDAGEHTRVTWGFSGKNKFPTSIFMLFMNMDKAVGKDFEEGLDKLKAILENNK